MQKTLQDFDFKYILTAFGFQDIIVSAQPYGSGHINDTFYLSTTGNTDYLLQRVNHLVFRNVPALMQNMQYVIAHLQSKLRTTGHASDTMDVLTLVPTVDGKFYTQDLSGNYWRLCHFLTDAVSYDIVTRPEQAVAGGRAFGQFQYFLSDLSAGNLTETIPDFHNVEKRLVSFYDALSRDTMRRAAGVLPEIRFVQEREHDMCTILRWGREGRLPLRITHNDTKFNNVLLDRADNIRCVIDLDTVMPGYVAYDFGDAVRTLVNTAAEDEKDLEKIQINLVFFEAFTRGFLQETGGFLTPSEIQSLSAGVLLLPYLMGLRFLTDYLDGDVYYKTAFPDHNLQRCRAQFQLLRKLEEHYAVMEDCIKRIAEEHTESLASLHENGGAL